jgi:hypothetical protein
MGKRTENKIFYYKLVTKKELRKQKIPSKKIHYLYIFIEIELGTACYML